MEIEELIHRIDWVQESLKICPKIPEISNVTALFQWTEWDIKYNRGQEFMLTMEITLENLQIKYVREVIIKP